MDAKRPEYKVVIAVCTDRLAFKVTELMQMGWKPQGGISGFYTAAGYHYQQAMVR
jgi:hypothetical protein